MLFDIAAPKQSIPVTVEHLYTNALLLLVRFIYVDIFVAQTQLMNTSVELNQ